MNFTVKADGSLVMADDYGGALTAKGEAQLTTRTMDAEQLARHRRDPAFEAALPADVRAAADAAAAVDADPA